MLQTVSTICRKCSVRVSLWGSNDFFAARARGDEPVGTFEPHRLTDTVIIQYDLVLYAT